MDTWAFIIIVASVILYFASKKQNVFLLTTGVGVGLLWGAIWAQDICQAILSKYLP